MDTEFLLTGHQEHQSDGGTTHCGVRADGQLANGLVEQQHERVVSQPGGEITAEQKRQEVRHKSGFPEFVSLVPAGRASLDPQLDAEQADSGIVAHLDVFVVHRAEDWRDRGKQRLQA